jgi:hypothetical protein
MPELCGAVWCLRQVQHAVANVVSAILFQNHGFKRVALDFRRYQVTMSQVSGDERGRRQASDVVYQRQQQCQSLVSPDEPGSPQQVIPANSARRPSKDLGEVDQGSKANAIVR